MALALLLGSCGGDDGSDGGSDPSPRVSGPTAWPVPAGKSLAELREELGPGPVLAPAVSVLEAGKKNRFGFGLFDRSRKQVAEAPVAIYVSKAGDAEVRGPFEASYESLAVEDRFSSESVTADPDAASSVYVAGLEFAEPGDYELLGVVQLDDRLVAADRVAVKVVEKAPVPGVGDRAPRIHTPTVDDVGEANIGEIDTRVPPAPELHRADFADVVGKKPVVLIFATPALCQSRVCGPVVDVALQVEEKHGDAAEFIHMEIFKDNELDKGFRKQVLDWNLPTEPWAFVVGKDGKVAARLEGAYSVRELDAAVEKAL